MGFSIQRDAEPLPGYRLREPLGNGGNGAVWKCEAPGGLQKAIKFVHGNLNSLDEAAVAGQELEALERIKTIRHPFLLTTERVDVIDGQLVIVMELADLSLRELLGEYQAAGKPGIPREELLGYLREAAEVLDVMSDRHQLQHLDIKPDNLLLVSNHIKVADFGLVHSSFEARAGEHYGLRSPGLSPLYSSPEKFLGKISPNSDQYSLAVVYQELLTGTLPFPQKNARQLLLHHARHQPDLDRLPAGDRSVVARALDKEPRQRFPSCTEFVNALFAGSGPRLDGHPAPPSTQGRALCGAAASPLPPLKESVQNLLASTVGPVQICWKDQLRYVIHTGSVLSYRGVLALGLVDACLRLEVFCREWNAKVVEVGDGFVVFRVGVPGGSWRRWLGRQVGLTISIHLQPQPGCPDALLAVTAQLEPFGSETRVGAQVLREVGPLLLESLAEFLEPIPDRRGEERLICDRPVLVYPLIAPRRPGGAVLWRSKDLSQIGMRLWSPRAPATRQVGIPLNTTSAGVLVLYPAEIRRVRPAEDGGVEVGVHLVDEPWLADLSTPPAQALPGR